jgi:uncharacterized membrane protein YecN with MAPEG domain
MKSHGKQIAAIIEQMAPVVSFPLSVTKVRGNKVELITDGVIVFIESNGATEAEPQVTFEVHAAGIKATTRRVVQDHPYGLKKAVARALSVVALWKLEDAVGVAA